MPPTHHQDFPNSPNNKGRDRYYVQRSVDAELLDHCQNARPTYILQSPQMGKTSLIAHAIKQLNANTHQAVHIDLSQFPLSQREEDWFYFIVRILDDQLDLTTDVITWWSKPSVFALPPYIRLTKLITDVILPEMTIPIVLFIDEVERTMTLPFRDHFFEWLTSMYESRATNSILYRISFVISGMANPSQLIPDGGPLLFQWSHSVVLSDFTAEETLALARKLNFHQDDTEEIAEWVYKWTNGHPYLTQLLFQILEEQHRTVWLEKEVDECVQSFITSPEGLHEPHFQYIRTALTEPDANGVNLLGTYLNLLKGKTENLKTNQTSLEQLRLIGVLRENDDDTQTEILIRNSLYEEIFSLSWVKRHLFPQGAVTSSPASQAGAWYVTALQPSNLMAASLFLLGVGLLVWFFGPQSSKTSIVTAEKESSAPIESSLIAKQAAELEPGQKTPEALAEAQKKIQELELSIARYQDLLASETQSIVDHRNQFDAQLASKKEALSTIQNQVEMLKAESSEQQQVHNQAIAALQTERDKLETKSTTTEVDLQTALEEVKTLQMAVLKKSSLSPSEINQIVADRSKLDAQLQTANTELALAYDRTRELESRLSQQQQLVKHESEVNQQDRADLETQIHELATTIADTRQTLSTTQEKSQEQATLAQTELRRLRKDRTHYQELLGTSQQELSALTTQTVELKNTVKQKNQTIQEEQGEIDQLQTRRAQLTQKLNSATTQVASLEDQLSTAGMKVAQSKKTIEAIHASSSEQNRRAEEKATELTLVGSTLQAQLQENQAALGKAQERIAQLTETTAKQLQEKQTALREAQERIAQLDETSAKMSATEANLKKTTEERDSYSQKLQNTQQQLAKSQEQKKQIERSLRAASSNAKSEATNNQTASTARYNSALEGDIVKVVSRITAKLTQSPSPIQSRTAKLLWARQAYELNLQTQGAHWSAIDRSLRDGLHASPIKLKGVSSKVHTITFDPSGDHMIAGTSDGTMLVWSMNDPLQSPKQFSGHTASVLSTAVSPDGQRIASGSLDSTIRLWNLSDSTASPLILQAHQKGATTLAFRPDGKELASGSQDHTIRLWDLTREEPQPVTLGTHAGRVNALAYTPDGKTLISGGDDLALRVWDIQRKDSPPKILKGHRQSISTVSIHPSGWMVATGSRDRQIGLWNLRQSLTPPTFLSGSKGRVSQIQFSTDGTSLASVSSDKSLRVWNWQEPKQPPIQFPGHKGTLEAMAISPDGRTIAVGGSSQSVTLWTGTEQLAHTVCDTARENLSFLEWKKMVGENIPYERTCPNLPLHPTFLEEGKKLARQGAHKKARAIFERAKQLDPYLKIDLDTELKKLSAKLFNKE